MAEGLPNLPTDALASYPFAIEIDRSRSPSSRRSAASASEIDVVELKENTPDGKLDHPEGARRGEAADDHAQARQELVEGALGLARGDASRARSATRRKNGSVIFKSFDGTEVARYNFDNAWPSKITTGTLKAGANEVAHGRGLASSPKPSSG